MIVTAWNGGNNGAGYGIRVRPADRDEYFSKWEYIRIRIAGKKDEIACNLADSFWTSCPEFRSAELREWFAELGHIRKTQSGWERSWQNGKPSKFDLTQISGNCFCLKAR